MGGFVLKIVVLTSSRADYSNYLPLLKKLRADTYFNLKIIAFGTHLSEKYGNTVDAIYKDGFDIAYKLETLPYDNSPEGIAKSMGLTIEKFAEVWSGEQNNIDLIICLGDRYEMFAAVSSSIPFNIPVAHLYGGDTTLGAIDNVFRHALSTMSKYHFTSLESSAKRIAQITGSSENIYSVGVLGLDNLREVKLLSKKQFQQKFNIDLNSPVLVTFHPETIAYEKNEQYVHELIEVLKILDKQIIITMPNADTMGSVIKKALLNFAKGKKNVYPIETFGTIGYYSCLKHCCFVLGNSSSGIAEAASFGKYVIDIGRRQEGRETGENVIHCEINKKKILNAIASIPTLPKIGHQNIYGDGRTADRIIKVLKSLMV